METSSKLIVVTGGAGFVGSHLCERLVQDGHKVISLDNYFTGSRENHVPGVEYREGHTKDIASLIPEKPDIVYHLGEYSRVEKSFEDIDSVFDLNTTGTFAVLEFCRARHAKIVYAGSSTKFGDGGLGRDQSPYAFAKATNTELVKNYGNWYGLPYAITYFYNVYGPREIARGPYATVIGIFKEEYRHGRPITVTAPGTQTRFFTHVSDIVSGLVAVGEKGEGDGYGIGNETPYAIIELARMFSNDIMMLPERPGNRTGSLLETEKTKSLGWRPAVDLQEEISRFKKETTQGGAQENRVLVYTTTFYPDNGPAEEALCALMEKLPDVVFDIVTTVNKKENNTTVCPVSNAVIHRVGWGTLFDKFLLPILGAKKGRELLETHSYLFAWSLVASYGTLGILRARRKIFVPLLVTLADQRISWSTKILLRFVMRSADQVYASLPEQKHTLRKAKQSSLGDGDAFANQIRFVYSSILQKKKM